MRMCVCVCESEGLGETELTHQPAGRGHDCMLTEVKTKRTADVA